MKGWKCVIECVDHSGNVVWKPLVASTNFQYGQTAGKYSLPKHESPNMCFRGFHFTPDLPEALDWARCYSDRLIRTCKTNLIVLQVSSGNSTTLVSRKVLPFRRGTALPPVEIKYCCRVLQVSHAWRLRIAPKESWESTIASIIRTTHPNTRSQFEQIF